MDLDFKTIVGETVAELLSGYRNFTNVLSSEVIEVASSRVVRSSVIGDEGLIIVQLEFKCRESYGDEEPKFTVLYFLKEATNVCVGKLKIKDQLPCPLAELLDTYIMPWPNSARRYALPYSNYVKLIPVSTLPGISSIHRREAAFARRNFERELREWLNFIWRSKLSEKDLNSIKPPIQVKEKAKCSKGAEFQKIFVSEIWTAMQMEHFNSGSRLSFLPMELVEVIYRHVEQYWKSSIETRGVFASVVAQVPFPKPKGINVNMMPIVLGDLDSIPKDMRQYLPLLAACPLNREEFYKIGYLTIHESTVKEDGKSQRREGLHTETPGKIQIPYASDCSLPSDVKGSWRVQAHVPQTIAWGRGVHDGNLGATYEYIGGIYMASNVADSCRIWNCKVNHPEEFVGHLGDIENMRSFLGQGETLSAGEVVWITDCTPHESLPLKKGTKRQYFRLVTSDVTVWYEDHSTPNPLGIKPSEGVKIVSGNKFAKPHSASASR